MKVLLAMAVRPNSVTFRPVYSALLQVSDFASASTFVCSPADNNDLVAPRLIPNAWTIDDLCMATKTISIEIDAYELLVREKRYPRESFSRVIRRVLSERPAMTAGDLLAAMEAFQGKGAGPRRRRDRNAAA